MSNKARERKSYSMEFKLRMLKEYYEVRASGIYGTKEIRIIQGDRSRNGEREAPGGELAPTQGVGLLRVAQ